MILFSKGNLWQLDAEALVNTVNTVGVMGKGIALQFKQEFPHNYAMYRDACQKKSLTIGRLLTSTDQSLLLGTRTIINFPTKQHWRNPSRYEYIEKGLIALCAFLKTTAIRTVAIPALGSGNGGLDWTVVKKMIEKYLSGLPQEITVYEPAGF